MRLSSPLSSQDLLSIRIKATGGTHDYHRYEILERASARSKKIVTEQPPAQEQLPNVQQIILPRPQTEKSSRSLLHRNGFLLHSSSHSPQRGENGAVAQLGERCVRNAEVEGSTPFRSTRKALFTNSVNKAFSLGLLGISLL